MSERAPRHIQEAKLSGNTELLSKGGKKAAEKRRLEKEILVELEEEKKIQTIRAAALQAARHYTLSDEGDILPPKTANH